MKYFKYIVAFAIIVLFGLYAFFLNLMNSDLITLKFLPSFEWQLSTATFLLGTFVLGLLSGALLVSLSLVNQKLKTGKANRQLKKIEKEVEGLRAMSVEVS